MSLEALIAGIGAGMGLTSLAIVLRYLPRVRRATKEHIDAAEIIHVILGELRDRLDRQDKKVAEHGVKLDLIEVRVLGRVGEAPAAGGGEKLLGDLAQARSSFDKARGLVASRDMQAGVTAPSGQIGPTESIVLGIFRDGPKTSTYVQGRTGKSREHVARLLKDLHERGLLERDVKQKPYTYSLSELGRRVLGRS